MPDLRERILATIAAAEKRLALAEAVQSGEWIVAMAELTGPFLDAAYEHADANDPPTVAAEQRRIIAAGRADLMLLGGWTFPGDHYAGIVANLEARYPEVPA